VAEYSEAAKSFSESERQQALDLAKRAKDVRKIEDHAKKEQELLHLLDDAHAFAVACLFARGPVHKGEPKITHGKDSC
jgi:hypothetical protein